MKSLIKRILKKVGISSGKKPAVKKKETVNITKKKEADDPLKLLKEDPAWKEEEKELNEAREYFAGIDRDHLWAFVSGQQSQDFRGNPKYLFAYINKYRPDIKSYWFCSDEDTIAQVRSLNFRAYKLESPAAQYLMSRTGVVVAEQVKDHIPDGFTNVKYINLWHGVGFKTSERLLHLGDISMGIARKYIRRGTFYRDNQLMNAPCPIVENEEGPDCGIDPDKFIRTGYPRCLYQQNYDPVVTFNHDLKGIKGLSQDAKLVVYAPTYRADLGETLSTAIPDFDALYDFCEKNNILFIFKVHPNMEKEVGFLNAREKYGDKPHFWFWDNRYDFYEIMHQMDLAIIDYSSIISDMVAMGVKHYIRYVFDFEEYKQTTSVHDDNFMEVTTGEICYSFEDLLKAISSFEQRDESKEIERLNRILWSYSHGKEDFDSIIDDVFNFKISKRDFPSLYSFDVFDTVLSRKVLAPEGIFYLVCEKMFQNGGFSYSFIQDYPQIRKAAEAHVRTYYARTKDIRQSERVEITFDEIFGRIASIYGLSESQITLLKQWELAAEMENVVPLPKQIDLIKELLGKHETVILISDMYLPKDFIVQLLYKADPVLAKLPLFLSNEYGVLKTSRKLYFEVYKSFAPFYDFKKWIHYGDNHNADTVQARNFGINTRKVTKPAFNGMERGLVNYIKSYDSYLVAGMQARLRETNYAPKDEFVISYVALCFVPYIDWVLRDALKRGYKTLYFISRDGHHLKRIADVIIKVKGLPLKTKYLYASRRTWRVPSFVKKVDEGFWLPYGSFNGISSKEKLLEAMELDENTFYKFFPYIDIDNINYQDQEEINRLTAIFKNSGSYNEYLLAIAAQKRTLVCGYLKQEIDASEKFAVVEFWGRGYTQDCMVNLWQDILQDDTAEVPFYYCRSVLPTTGAAIRYNFTTNNFKQFLIEAIFANMPYKSIEEYQLNGTVIEPIIKPISYDKDLFNSMSKLLPLFAEEYAKIDFVQPEIICRRLYDFVFKYYDGNLKNLKFADNVGHLKDSANLYGKKREYAPPFTMKLLEQFENKEVARNSFSVTTSISLSVTRSREEVQRKYFELYQILPGESYSGGRLLSPKEREENEEFRQKHIALEERAVALAELYNAAVETTAVENKIILITNGTSIKNTGLDLLKKELDKTKKYTVQVMCLSGKTILSDELLSKELASAKYIFTNEIIDLLCKVNFREETKEVLLPSVPFVLYNRGPATSVPLKWKSNYMKLKGENDISVMQIPSVHREDFFRRNFCHTSNVDCSLLGNVKTDLYFSEAFRTKAEEKLIKLFPEAKDKKRILYSPLWRTRKDSGEWLRVIDLEALHQLIGEEYVVIINFNKDRPLRPVMNKLTIPGFSKELNKGMFFNELLLTCDVIVGDYRDGFFESTMLHKPVYSTADDYENVIQSGNMSINANDFENFLFCPLISSAEDLVEELKKIDKYDFTPMEKFREWMFGSCDGHSAERVIRFIMNDEKESEFM